jgi:hypothetical protein
MNDLPLRPAADIGGVDDRFFTLRNFPLADGTVMPEATIAYETYGRPAPQRPQRHLVHAWLHRKPPFRRSARLVGRPDRAGQGDRHRQIVLRRLEHARLVLRFDQMPAA